MGFTPPKRNTIPPCHTSPLNSNTTQKYKSTLSPNHPHSSKCNTNQHPSTLHCPTNTPHHIKPHYTPTHYITPPQPTNPPHYTAPPPHPTTPHHTTPRHTPTDYITPPQPTSPRHYSTPHQTTPHHTTLHHTKSHHTLRRVVMREWWRFLAAFTPATANNKDLTATTTALTAPKAMYTLK